MSECTINLDYAQRVLAAYPGAAVPQLDASAPIDKFLDSLAVAALAPSNTLAYLAAYRSVFLDLVSRWICQCSQMEEKYTETYGQTVEVSGRIVLAALGRIAGVAPETTAIAERFIAHTNILQAELKAHGDDTTTLLAYYRLLRSDAHRFKKYVSPEWLHDAVCGAPSVRRYLSIEILACVLDAEGAAQLDHAQHSVRGDYDGDIIDYQFMGLAEAQRMAVLKKVEETEKRATEKRETEKEETGIKKSKRDATDRTLKVPSEALSALVTSVCGVLVPVLGEHRPSAAQLVPIASTVQVLQTLATLLQQNAPVMLHGAAGAGKTAAVTELAHVTGHDDTQIVKIHLGEQTDSKLLLGTYTSGDTPGTFKWKPGVLTNAVAGGKWVLIEDIDRAPTEVLSVLLTLLEKRELTIPSRGEVVHAANGFQIFLTVRTQGDDARLPDMIGARMWRAVHVPAPLAEELAAILAHKFELLAGMVPAFIRMYDEIRRVYALSRFLALNRGAHPRGVSVRDLIKFCARCARMMRNEGVDARAGQLIQSAVYDNIFAEAIDTFGSSLTEAAALEPLVHVIGEVLEIPTLRINLYLRKHVPVLENGSDEVHVGRARLTKLARMATRNGAKPAKSVFANTAHSLRLMEQIAVAVQLVEPVLLVGETGTGKTTVVQQVAQMMNKRLTVINVSQQTEAGDLLGGYKPVSAKMLAAPLLTEFRELFAATFSEKKNEKFVRVLLKCFNREQWKNVLRLWREGIKMARGRFGENSQQIPSDNKDENNPKEVSPGSAKRSSEESSSISKRATPLLTSWNRFADKLTHFETQVAQLDTSFVFNFVEGSVVQAVRNGDWLLLDEINLALSDTLEAIADLLLSDTRTVLLTERGDLEPVVAHPDFRIFGCMNPSTDVGKRDLPVGIRARFSEIYVHLPDGDIGDLLMIIDQYIRRFAVGDEWVGHDIAELYMSAKRMLEENRIVDGSNQRPHFSIRTLTRTLTYVRDLVPVYGLRRALYEGFCMSFLTLLDVRSEAVLLPEIERHILGRMRNVRSVMAQAPAAPSPEHIAFKHYWMERGPLEPVEQPHYILTPFVEKNMMNVVRAICGRRFPVLIQGPTSAGKTSMIQYLAAITGHKFVRINNHEHTDLQEYLGTYVSDSNGRLVFREGVLVEALREGHWLVLDELNLAPTDVLEALNRLLDDNRELFIPELGEVVRPHRDFMLFATQNPPGMYGGRKALSRAFRNRFLELHFDDIPQDELEVILRDRCRIAPTYGKKIVEVYRQLLVQRQLLRLFEHKNSFATLRDLFRWALRDAVGYEELAANGYMLLAERVRNADERAVVQATIERVMRVKLDMDAYYFDKLEDKSLLELDAGVVWTKAMRRLAVLVATSVKYHEPLLLVGETGCGKTTVCQLLAQHRNKQLVTVNAHMNTETGDLLGAQRPVRNKPAQLELLARDLRAYLGHDGDLAEMLAEFDRMAIDEPTDLTRAIVAGRRAVHTLFEWADGPLVHAMKTGDFFLLDEISLADDSVLERLNSVLEPERSLFLAEKPGGDSMVTAAEGFEFFATMNPGGDYGKKELSPALRNRFTEVWVPLMSDMDDVRAIVRAKVCNERYVDSIVGFAQWYGETYGVVSLRDVLAWVQFVNSRGPDAPFGPTLLSGASMVFIDALGTNNTAYLAEDDTRLAAAKAECVAVLSRLANVELSSTDGVEMRVTSEGVECMGMTIKRGGEADKSPKEVSGDFLFTSPTTALNTMRVLRALQVAKPVLLEGSPGVGKTSLVTALARSTNHPLIRINLSEQTDLVDLFGADAPAEGGATGQFTWRDAPFLRAMKRGEWVLLDEMNLASQLVLEGLNACLDHRGEAYIPELDMSFPRHPDFRVFAAQNPQYQGGGRKGLPKSFVNRFLVVYVDVLKQHDLELIALHLYGERVSHDVITALIAFVARLEHEVVVRRSFGASGAPWEFNLRDTLRWLQLLATEGGVAGDYFDMIVRLRFRTAEDRERATALFEETCGPLEERDPYFMVNKVMVQAGLAQLSRGSQNETALMLTLIPTVGTLQPLQCNNTYMETLVRCVKSNVALILTGPANAGKTSLVRYMAGVAGARLEEFAMNADVDLMDILGGYEQVDLTRRIRGVVGAVQQWCRARILRGTTDSAVYELMSREVPSRDQYDEYHAAVATQCPAYLVKRLEKLAVALREPESVRFEWFDGLLVHAVMAGSWLVLDNANLCSPSVLDRLNSLLETDGMLIINECSEADGSPRTVRPHPDFRLFLTVDPRYGELSRAMRNRGVEVFMDELPERATFTDARILEGVVPPSYVGSHDLVWAQVASAIEKEKEEGAMILKEEKEESVKEEQEEKHSESEDMLYDSFCLVVFASLPAAQRTEIAEWAKFVGESRYFDRDSKTMAAEVLRLQDDSKRLLSIDTSISTSPFGELHSLWNPIGAREAECDGSEPTLYFDVIYRVLAQLRQIEQVERVAMNAPVGQLNYLQRSAAAELGRSMRHTPRLPVYAVVKQTLAYIAEHLLEGSARALHRLVIIWSVMFGASSDRNEAKMRVFHELVAQWAQEHEAPELARALAGFTAQMALTTGHSVDRIWEHERGIYPTTAEAWTAHKQLCALADEFDDVAAAQFPETAASVVELRQLLVDVIAHGDPGVYERLRDGITALREVSAGFVIKRRHVFEEDFRRVQVYVEMAEAAISGVTKMSPKALELSVYSNVATRSFAPRPYTRVLERAGRKVFTPALVADALTKVHGLGQQPGKDVDQALRDARHLSAAVVNHSTAIVSDHVARARVMLVRWVARMAEIHKEKEGEEKRQQVEESDNKSISFVIEALREASTHNSAFATISEEFFEPAVAMAETATTVAHMGRAWVMFAAGAIQLYVPSTPYDPAIREHIAYEVYEAHSRSAAEIAANWRRARVQWRGEAPLALERAIEHPAAMARPRVYRPAESIDGLFEEWRAFLDSTVDVGPVKALVASIEGCDELAPAKMHMFANNSTQFLRRMDATYVEYLDLNDILSGYVHAMRFGLECMETPAGEGIDTVWLVSASDLAKRESVADQFEVVRPELVRMDIVSSVPETLLVFFVRLALAHGADELLSALLLVLHSRWAARRAREEADNAQQDSLYSYGEEDEDVEMRNMFGDEDGEDVPKPAVLVSNASFEDAYYDVARMFVDTYVHGRQPSLEELVAEGATVHAKVSKDEEHASEGHGTGVLGCGAAPLCGLILGIHGVVEKFSAADAVDFYHGSSAREAKRAIGVICNVHTEVQKHLQQWPEHATLQEIARACSEYLELPVATPLSRLLQKVEQIYTHVAEWEKYALSQVTLSARVDELTSLIVSWRKLELATWQALFAQEDAACARGVGRWWFHLYEVLAADEQEPSAVLAALTVFMGQADYGSFKHRLQLVAAFREAGINAHLRDALANFVTFYSQFVPVIDAAIAERRKTLEKEINEVILLASWKDVNVDALKQSARRSHAALFKVVRKYRTLLQTGASAIVEAGLTGQQTSVPAFARPVVPVRAISDDIVAAAREQCTSITLWDSRPARLQNSTVVVKNMAVFVDEIARAQTPSLYEFAKDVLERMDQLRAETPTTLRKDNKKVIAALKTQKHKLLSDTLRELRRMGLKTAVLTEVARAQPTVTAVLANAAALDGTPFAGCDAHLFRILDLLPRVRAAVSSVAADVPPADAQKGLAIAENLVYLLVAQRTKMVEMAGAVDEMASLVALMQAAAEDEKRENEEGGDGNEFVAGSTLEWLGRLLGFALAVLEASGSSVEAITRVQEWQSQCAGMAAKLAALDNHITTVHHEQFASEWAQWVRGVLEALDAWDDKHAFVGAVILQYLRGHPAKLNKKELVEMSEDADSASVLEKQFRDLATASILAVQRLKKTVAEVSTEDDGWLKTAQQQVFLLVKALHYRQFVRRMRECVSGVVSAPLAALCTLTLPFVAEYMRMNVSVMAKVRDNYVETAHATFILLSALHTLSTKGFCEPEPPTEQKEDQNMTDGTGLGDGEGAENNSNDVEDDEDLTEQAQQPNEDQKDRDEEDDNDDAVDIEGDMAGEMEELSEDQGDDGDEDEEGDDMDEEVDDIDDADPNAVDEKMWDDESKEDKEKDSDEMQNGQQDDEMGANEDEAESKDDTKKDKENANDKEEGEKDDGEKEDGDEEDGEDGEEGDEEEDVGEQEDEVKNEENEQMDDHVPEADALDLPEDMNLDGDEKEDNQDDDDSDDFDDGMDVDEKEERDDEERDEEAEHDEKAESNEEAAEDAENEDEDGEDEDGEDDIAADKGEDAQDDGEEDGNEAEEVEDLGEKQEQPNEAGQDAADAEEGVDGANEEQDDIDNDAAAKQESGEQGEGADNQVMDDQDDVGATGGASAELPQDSEKNDAPDEAREQAKESLKQLGDALKEFHRRREEIQEAAEHAEEEQPEKAAERPDDFEHVDGENADFDTQAMGAADKDQIQRIDDDMAIDDDEDEVKPEPEVVEPENVDDDAVRADDNAEEAEEGDADDQNDDFEGKKGAVIGERKPKDEFEDAVMGTNTLDMDTDDEMEDAVNVPMDESSEAPLDMDTARALWKNSELATQELASGLCEQLRLILEPTLATKLKGDYKTGKRLNMKRIITYIASEFRKDKIWLRRTKPSKRQYQIMIAVDDSKSMSESKSTELAFHSIALVAKALTQLESGGLSVVRFGEDIKVVHPFDRPFNNQESGARIFQWFDFQQTRTDIKKLCQKSLEVFEGARSAATADLWQLQIIISDGVCEDHATIQRMVRRAREEKVMLVFVIIDGILSKESILDMSQVSYVPDANGNMKLKVDKYLDSFPFEFYVVVRDINELPQMLSLILRQYFSEVATH